MKIYQLFYTSCKKGLSSGMGFQTYSMSEGIKEEEREEIESHCSYIPPENLTGHPTETEINELFPVSFSFFRLKSGRYCICRTKYKGRDYSGRFGNYFCHVLIIGERELNFYPIELYGSTVFRDGLTTAEEKAAVITPLTTLEKLPKGEVITLKTIEEFIKGGSAKKRTKSLNELLDGIIDAKVNDKKIFFCDKKANIPLWIAAATMTLPISIAISLTFNTYRFDTGNRPEFICGTIKDGTRVNFRESNTFYAYNLFNFEEAYTYEFNIKSKFAKQVSLGYTIIKDYRKALIGFLELFEYKEVNANIDNCVNLLSLVNNGIDRLSEEETLKAIAFANEYAFVTALEQIMNKLNEDTLKKISLKLNLNLAEVIFKFFFKIAKITEKKEYKEKAYEFFFHSLNSMLVETEEIRLEDIINLYNNVRDYNFESLRNFITPSMDIKRLKVIITYLDKAKLRQAKFYLCIILGDFIKVGTKEHKVIEWKDFGNNGCFSQFAEKALNILVSSKKELKATLDYVLCERDYFINLILLSYKVALSKDKEQIVITIFNDYLSELDFQETTEIRKIIMENNLGSKILMNSFSYEIKNAEDKKSFFKNYCKKVFNNNQKFKDQCFSVAMEEFLKSFNYMNFTLEDYIWFVRYVKDERPNKILEVSLCEKIIISFQIIIPIRIGDNTTQNLIQDINDLVEWYFINLKLNIGEIMFYATQLEDNKISVSKFLIDTRAFSFEGIEEERYEEILKLMFSLLCPYLKETASHSRLKRILLHKCFSETYFKTYINIISDIFNNSDDYKEDLKISCKKPYEIYLEAIYFLLKNQELLSESEMEKLKIYIIDDLIALDSSKLSNYNMYMHGIISNTSIPQKLKSIRLQWEDMYESLCEGKLKRKFINKLQSIYKR
ncbi:MAG: hypothetical protein H7Y18_11850 [Clostridiaceae bacterium]|nr:hypothetical protein [Clostridiaceae bacterium]